MASFFGEVRPLFSRAVDDEDVDVQSNYKISSEVYDGQSNYNAKIMIVSVGEIASIFVRSHFMQNDSNLICSIKYSCVKDDDDSLLYTGVSKSSKKLTVASVYKSRPDVLICDISKPVPDEMCSEVTDLIFKNYPSSEIVVLTSKHMAAFKGENSVYSKSPFLKSLFTSYYKNSYTCNVSSLKPPNFLTNMAASILLRCEVSKLPAVCFVSYVDTDAVDYLIVHIFDEILNDAIVSKVPVDADAKSKVIKFVKAKQSIESNLYT